MDAFTGTSRELAVAMLNEAERETGLIDWEVYEEEHLAKAELFLKKAHVYAMLAVADETEKAARR